ncbi:MAG: hypothetical protein PHY90_00150 [Desulfitobacteriaceae bacterium]|nr:hypothetical protein [Desulfitobacteriaceae bacterium]
MRTKNIVTALLSWGRPYFVQKCEHPVFEDIYWGKIDGLLGDYIIGMDIA